MRWAEKDLADYLERHGVPGAMPRINTSEPPFAAPARYALGRLPTGKMNKTEEAYDRHLWSLRYAGEVLWHAFEAIKLRLADNTFYTVDFAVLAKDCVLEMHEVKGFWEDDARVKIKVAAAQFPFRFKAFKPEAKKRGGGWKEEAF